MSFTRPLAQSLVTIPPCTLIEAHGLDGKLLATWNCQQSCAQVVASLALVIKLAAVLEVPRRAIHLIWDPMQPAVDDQGTHRVNVKVVLRHLEPYDVKYKDNQDPQCLSCEDPCEDADYDSVRTRKENCYRCTPDLMCDSCRVLIPQKGWVCFLCLEEAELVSLNHAQRRRYDLAKTLWGD